MYVRLIAVKRFDILYMLELIMFDYVFSHVLFGVLFLNVCQTQWFDLGWVWLS